jgi:hypothetical protein
MSNLGVAAISIIIFNGSIVFGYLIGVVHERIRWNRLIDDGVLPKPSKKE